MNTKESSGNLNRFTITQKRPPVTAGVKTRKEIFKIIISSLLHPVTFHYIQNITNTFNTALDSFCFSTNFFSSVNLVFICSGNLKQIYNWWFWWQALLFLSIYLFWIYVHKINTDKINVCLRFKFVFMNRYFYSFFHTASVFFLNISLVPAMTELSRRDPLKWNLKDIHPRMIKKNHISWKWFALFYLIDFSSFKIFIFFSLMHCFFG